MKPLRGKFLFLAFALVATVSSVAQTNKVFTTPAPDWVRLCEWKGTNVPAKRDNSDGSRYLVYERQENPSTQETFKRVVLLLENETGVQDSGSLRFEFNPLFQELFLHAIQIHRDGKVLPRLDPSRIRIIQPEPGLDGHIITGEQTALIFVEDLRVGDVLEYSHTIRGENPVIGDHFSARATVQSGAAVDRQRIRVVWSSPKTLHIRQHLTTAQPRKNPWKEGDTEYLWDYTNVTAISFEDDLPSGYEAYPYLEFTDFESWDRVVEWALPLYAVNSSNMPSALRDLIAEWRQRGASAEERARLALQFVQDDLRYTGIELGPESYRPADPFETFQLRYGDCKGKVSLLCTILRELGIEAWPALVNTSAREAVARRLPSPFVFDHVIVKLSLLGDTLWVDPTISHQGGTLWQRFVPRYGSALVIQPGVKALELIPPPDPARFRQRVISTFRFKDYEAPVAFAVQTIYDGYLADDMREYLARTEASEVSEKYLNFYARYYPGIAEPQPLQVQDDRVRNVVTLTEQYRINNFWKTNSDGRFKADFYADNIESVLTVPETRIRKMPLSIPYPLWREQTLVVHLPDTDWDIPTLQNSLEHEAFSFSYRRTFSKSTARFQYECRTKVSEISANQVPEYLEQVQAMENLLGDSLYRPLKSGPNLLANVNWLMVAVAFATFVIAAAVAVALWFLTRARRDPSLPPPVPGGKDPLEGLRGWLILVGFGLIVSLFRRIWAVFFGDDFFSYAAWEMITTPGNEAYHPLYAPLVTLELIANTGFLVLNALVIALFFRKRRFFRAAYIALLIGWVIYLVLDEIAGRQIPAVAANDDGSSLRQLRGAALGACIWTLYTIRSRRVKATFVR